MIWLFLVCFWSMFGFFFEKLVIRICWVLLIMCWLILQFCWWMWFWRICRCCFFIFFGRLLVRLVVGVLGCVLQMKEKEKLKLMFFISFMVCLKFFLVLLGKLMMKLELMQMFGIVVFSLWICDLYFSMVWLCFIVVSMWLEFDCIGRWMNFISFGILVWVWISVLENFSGCEVVQWMCLILLMVVIICSSLVKLVRWLLWVRLWKLLMFCFSRVILWMLFLVRWIILVIMLLNGWLIFLLWVQGIMQKLQYLLQFFIIEMKVVGLLICGFGRWLNFLIFGKDMLICGLCVLCVVLIIFGRWCRVCGLKIMLIQGVCLWIVVFFWLVMQLLMLIIRLGFCCFSLCYMLSLENIFFWVFLWIEQVLSRMMLVLVVFLVISRVWCLLSRFVICDELYLFIWQLWVLMKSFLVMCFVGQFEKDCVLQRVGFLVFSVVG